MGSLKGTFPSANPALHLSPVHHTRNAISLKPSSRDIYIVTAIINMQLLTKSVLLVAFILVILSTAHPIVFNGARDPFSVGLPGDSATWELINRVKGSEDLWCTDETCNPSHVDARFDLAGPNAELDAYNNNRYGINVTSGSCRLQARG
jgi:hypothetical protein